MSERSERTVEHSAGAPPQDGDEDVDLTAEPGTPEGDAAQEAIMDEADDAGER